MEIRAYLRFLRQRWWIIIVVFVLTLAATVFITVRTPPVYQATASYIVGLSPEATDPKNRISALDLLSNRGEIAGTYVKIANSRTVEILAAEQLGLTSVGGLSVNSQVAAGSNVLEIVVQGSDPARVRDFANAVGHQTSNYVQDLTENYELRVLDEAVLPTSPVKPNMSGNITLGAILGLALGLALAALREYLQVPAESSTNFNIMDERTGIYNMPYFMLRLRQEMSRAKRNGHSLSLALLNVDHGDLIRRSSPQLRIKALRGAAAILGPYLRNEDIMASAGEANLAFLLPDANGGAAKGKVGKLIEKLSLSPVELDGTGAVINLHATAGIATYRREKVGEEKSPEDLLADAQRELTVADAATYDGVNPDAGGVNAEHPSKSVEHAPEASTIEAGNA